MSDRWERFGLLNTFDRSSSWTTASQGCTESLTSDPRDRPIRVGSMSLKWTGLKLCDLLLSIINQINHCLSVRFSQKNSNNKNTMHILLLFQIPDRVVRGRSKLAFSHATHTHTHVVFPCFMAVVFKWRTTVRFRNPAWFHPAVVFYHFYRLKWFVCQNTRAVHTTSAQGCLRQWSFSAMSYNICI